MSDALLTEISKKLSDIHVALKAGAAPAAAAPKAAAAATADDAAKKAAAAAAAAAKKADDKKVSDAKAAATAKAAAATAAAKPAGPAAGTKAPGGKHTIEQVRAIIRKVAADDSLGMQSAKDILMDDGGGVEKVIELKPEFYDRVHEACEVLLNGEGSKKEAATASDPLDDL